MTREALIVGINYYGGFNRAVFQPLKAAAQDAEDIATQLKEYEYETVQIQLLPSVPNQKGEWKINPQDVVTSKQLQTAIEKLLTPAPPNPIPEVALFFFSGHGFRKNNGQEEVFLATSDFCEEDRTYGVSLRWLGKKIEESKVKKIVIWLDCCYSGALKSYLPKNKEYCILTATRPDETAIETSQIEKYQNGVFTKILLEGLNPNHDPDEVIDSHKLAKFIQERMTQGQKPICCYSDGKINLTSKFSKKAFQNLCPYRSLSYFTESHKDALVFFGRTQLTNRLIDLVAAKKRLIGVFGVSGSGKSSLIRAGLLCQLRNPIGKQTERKEDYKQIEGSEQWVYLDPFTPTDHPSEKLANAKNQLLKDQLLECAIFATYFLILNQSRLYQIRSLLYPPIIMIVDQFEECFTMGEEETRKAFIQGLIELMKDYPTLQLIIGMRDEFRGRLQEFPKFCEKMKTAKVNVKGLDKIEIREAIEKPAEYVGLGIGEGLKQQLINDVEDEGNSLPLLQYTLTQLWKEASKKDEEFLRLETYDRLGGIRGTLNKRADEVYQGLGRKEEEQLIHSWLNYCFKTDLLSSQQRLMVRTFSGSRSLFYQRITRKIFPGINYCFKTDLLLSKKTLMVLTFSCLISLFYQRIARKIFLELTQIGDTSDTRRRVKLGDLVNKYHTLNSFKTVIKTLVDERLIVTMRDNKEKNSSRLTTDESTVIDVIHEALIHHWSQLQKWKKEYQNYKYTKFKTIDLMGIERDLEKQAQQWKNNKKSSRYVLNLAGLDSATIYEQGTKKLHYEGMLYGIAEDFINQSRRFNRREIFLKQASAFFLISLLIASIAGIVTAVVTTNKAKQLEQISEATEIANTPGKEINALVMAISSFRFGNFYPDKLNKVIIKTIAGVKYSLPLALEGYQVALKGNQDYVRTAEFSPDGIRVITISDEGKAIVWSAKDGQVIQILNTEANEFIKFAQFSPDGKQIITTGDFREVKKKETRTTTKIIKGVVRLWNTETGTPTQTLEVGEKSIKKVIFDPPGQRIAIIEDWGTIQIWDLTTKRRIKTINPELEWGVFIDFSPDGKLLLVANSHTREIQKWDIETGKKISSNIIAKTDPNSSNRDEQLNIKALWWKDNNLRVVVVATSSPYNGRAILWDENNQNSIPLRGHTRRIRDADFSNDGTRLVTASEDRTARIWNAETGELITTLRGHTHDINFVTFSNDGNKLVTISSDRTVRIWDLLPPTNTNFQEEEWVLNAERRKASDNYQQDEYELFLPTLEISPDGKTLLTGTNQSFGGRLWDANTGKQIKDHKQGNNLILRVPYITSAQFSPASNHIAILANRSDEMYLRLWEWDGTSKEDQKLFSPQGEQRSFNVSDIHQGWGSLVFSHKGDRLAICTYDGTVSLWSVSKAQLIKETKINVENRYTSSVCQIDFSPDDQSIVTVIGSTITLWDTNTDQKFNFPTKENTGRLTSAQFSPDGKWIVTSGGDNPIATIWDVQQKTVHQELKGHKDWLNSAVFSPDSRYVVTASEDQKAGVWDVKTGKLRFWLEGHLDWVDSAVFSPDGSQILTVSRDGTARLWNAKTGNVLGVFGGTIGRNSNDVPVPLASAQFFPDGKKFVTMDKDGVVRIYSAESKTYVTQACQLLKHRSVYPEVKEQCERWSKH